MLHEISCLGSSTQAKVRLGLAAIADRSIVVVIGIVDQILSMNM
jgi:hypothetical protein